MRLINLSEIENNIHPITQGDALNLLQNKINVYYIENCSCVQPESLNEFFFMISSGMSAYWYKAIQ